MSIKGKFVFVLIALAVLCIPVFGQTTTNKTCEVRGQVATSDFTWNPQNFAGFYYDIKNDLGTETLSTTLTDKKLSGDSPYGVRYVTSSQPTEFKFENWGSYNMKSTSLATSSQMMHPRTSSSRSLPTRIRCLASSLKRFC
jgi:hypothetical protein